MKESAAAANSVLEGLGGYLGLADKFPFDRGEVNKELLLFCLRVAEKVQGEDPAVAERLRSAAMKIGMAATYSGSRQRSQEIKELITSVKGAIPTVGRQIDEVLASGESTLSEQVGRILQPKETRILLVFANPIGTPALRLQSEERAIKEAIKLSNARDRMIVKTLVAATVDDLRRELLSQEHQIVHFSGHGDPGSLVFESQEGGLVKSPLKAMAALFKQHPGVECVLLNACYSLSKLTAIAPYTVGMEKPVDDDAAIEFARAFYDAIAAGRSIDFAVEHGLNNVKLKDLQKKFPVKVIKPSAAGA